jgi:hypothetical protein
VYSGGVYLRYDDLREAAKGKVLLEQHGFHVESISEYQYTLAKSLCGRRLSPHLRQLSPSSLLRLRETPNAVVGTGASLAFTGHSTCRETEVHQLSLCGHELGKIARFCAGFWLS